MFYAPTRRACAPAAPLPFNSPTAAAWPARASRCRRARSAALSAFTRVFRRAIGDRSWANPRNGAGNATPRTRTIANGSRRKGAPGAMPTKRINAHARDRRATHPEYRARKQAADRRRSRAHDLKYCYGLSPQQRAAMLRRQKGACAICKAKGALGVDHCHTSGVIGGLLCRKCNSGLGFFRDNPASMLASASYLLQTRPEALSRPQLARTPRALPPFIKVLDEALAARPPKKAARCEPSLPVGLDLGCL